MKVITAPEKYTLKEGEVSVFLAGGITNCPNWQKEIIGYLRGFHHSNKLVVFNPRRENFPIHDSSAVYEQIHWEFQALEKMDIFSMYFCSGESVQPICLYELGRNLVRMQMRYPIDWKDRIVISVEDGYKRKQDVFIQTQLACDNLLVNHQINSILTHYHAEFIMKACNKLIRQ